MCISVWVKGPCTPAVHIPKKNTFSRLAWRSLPQGFDQISRSEPVRIWTAQLLAGLYYPQPSTAIHSHIFHHISDVVPLGNWCALPLHPWKQQNGTACPQIVRCGIGMNVRSWCKNTFTDMTWQVDKNASNICQYMVIKQRLEIGAYGIPKR